MIHFGFVVAKVTSDLPSEKQILWHWNPDCQVERKQNQIIGKRKERNLTAMPFGGQPWKIELIMGQEKPNVQDWYSEVHNVYQPDMTSINSSPKNESDVYVWLLFPSSPKKPKIRAKIVDQDSESIELEIQVKKQGRWSIKMPYYDCDKTKVDFDKD